VSKEIGRLAGRQIASGAAPCAVALVSGKSYKLPLVGRRKLSTMLTTDQITGKLRAAGLRPTRQRVSLCALLCNGLDRHVTAEQLHGEARLAGVGVSVATVYNTLHQFTEAGLLREVVVDGSKTHFDTNTSNHHHFLFPDGSLEDIPAGQMQVFGLPEPPAGSQVLRVDILVRLGKARR
jgi:Fur family iron response transcriptional regulator